jgi:Tfp pilus assembly protein FimT
VIDVVLAGCQQMELKARKRRNARGRRHRASGFTLLEMMIVVSLTITVALFSVLSLMPVLNQTRVTNAYNTTMSAMRQARDNAVSQRTSYSVTFSNSVSPNTIVVAPTLSFTGSMTSATYQLPPGVTFSAQTALASTTPPDGYGAGTAPIDFGYSAPGTGTGGQTVIYFCPDGSAQNSSGAGNCSGMNNWSGGVIYLGRPAPDILSQRALTVWGGTGRIRGWRLYSNGANYKWVRQ